MYLHLSKYFSLFLFFVATSNLILKAQVPYHWQLTDDEGLPSMTVYNIVQDHKGLIWLATANGLCSFDGKIIQKINTSSLNDQEILKIREGTDGNIWGMNLSGQTFYLKDGQINILDKKFDENIEQLLDFEWLGNSLLLINTPLGNNNHKLNSDRRKSQILSFSFVEGKLINNTNNINLNQFRDYIVLNNQNEKLTICNYNYEKYKIEVIDKEFNTIFKVENEIIKKGGIVKSLFWKNKLFVMSKEKCYVVNPKTEKNINFELINPDCNNIYTNENELFIIHNKGFSIYDEEGKIKSKSLFPKLTITFVLRDLENNLWLATNGSGLIIIPNINNILYDKYNSVFKSDAIFTLFKENDDNIYVGKKDSIINILDKKDNIKEFPITYKGRILSITSNEKYMFFGGDDGIICSDKSNKKLIKTNIPDPTKILFKSSKNIIYFGTNVAFGEINQALKFQNIKPIRTYAINETKDGTIWIGSSKGLYFKKNDKIELFQDEKLKNIRVTSLACDKFGKLWIASQSQGLFCISDNQIIEIPTSLNLASKNFTCILSDDIFVWFGTDNGIFRLNLINNEVFHINNYFGLPSNEIQSLAILNNYLFIGTTNGLLKISLDDIKPILNIPNIYLKKISINEIEITPNENNIYTLDYHQNNIFLKFQSYQYRSLGNAKYEYKISELDTSWKKNSGNYLRLANLKPGEYHITIRAINENGIYSNKNIELFFIIEIPFWQKKWFYLLTILASASIIGYYFVRKYQTELKIENLRMQALQAQMNPHFIFNSLNSIQHFLTINDGDNAVRYLSKFAKLIRTVFNFTKKDEISFDEELEMLNIYLTLEKMRFKDKIDIHINISKSLQFLQSELFLPPLLIQPIVENAFKHGLFHKFDKGNIWIDFDIIEENRIKCVITDDGVGRNLTKSLAKMKYKTTSTGLKTTEERIAHWHKIKKSGIKDFFIIEDLLSENQALGTKITMIL